MNYNEFEEYTINDMTGKIILIISDNNKLINNIKNKSSSINKTTVINLEKMMMNLLTESTDVMKCFLSTLQIGHFVPFEDTPITDTVIYHIDTIRKLNELLFPTADFILVCKLEATSFMLGYVRDKFQTADSFESIIKLYLEYGNIMIIDNNKYKIGYLNIGEMEAIQHFKPMEPKEINEITI